jgi:pilus assembly protein CpaE
VLDTLRASFDIVVVDTSGAFDDYSLQALDHTDLLLLVGTLDIPALKSLKLAGGTLDLLNFPRERRQLLLNRNDTKVGLSSDEFETTLGLTISASLASSRDVLTSVNRGEPIVRAQRSHQASKALAAFAVRLVSDLAVASRAMPTDTPSEADSAAPRRGARRGLRLRKVS